MLLQCLFPSSPAAHYGQLASGTVIGNCWMLQPIPIIYYKLSLFSDNHRWSNLMGSSHAHQHVSCRLRWHFHEGDPMQFSDHGSSVDEGDDLEHDWDQFEPSLSVGGLNARCICNGHQISWRGLVNVFARMMCTCGSVHHSKLTKHSPVPGQYCFWNLHLPEREAWRIHCRWCCQDKRNGVSWQVP